MYFAPGSQPRYDLFSIVQLWTLDGERLTSAEERPILRWLYPPDRWQPGDVVPVEELLPMPQDGLEWGAYQMAVGVRDGRDHLLTLVGPDGQPAGTLAAAVAFKVPMPPVTVEQPVQPVDATFGDQIALAGYELTDSSDQPTDRLQPGETGNLLLVWRAARRPDADYTVFVHAEDEAGNLVAQHDSPPDARYPTSVWSPGEVVVSSSPVTRPEGVAGPLTLYVGMYAWPSLQRLPAVQHGQPTPDSRAMLAILPAP